MAGSRSMTMSRSRTSRHRGDRADALEHASQFSSISRLVDRAGLALARSRDGFVGPHDEAALRLVFELIDNEELTEGIEWLGRPVSRLVGLAPMDFLDELDVPRAPGGKLVNDDVHSAFERVLQGSFDGADVSLLRTFLASLAEATLSASENAVRSYR